MPRRLIQHAMYNADLQALTSEAIASSRLVEIAILQDPQAYPSHPDFHQVQFAKVRCLDTPDFTHFLWVLFRVIDGGDVELLRAYLVIEE